jgi:hypothetical protein
VAHALLRAVPGIPFRCSRAGIHPGISSGRTIREGLAEASSARSPTFEIFFSFFQ